MSLIKVRWNTRTARMAGIKGERRSKKRPWLILIIKKKLVKDQIGTGRAPVGSWVGRGGGLWVWEGRNPRIG